jgi:hypothetical protein
MPALDISLMDYIRRLEGQSNTNRGDEIIAALRELGLEPRLQILRLPRIRNILVDFQPDTPAPKTLFSAHYDCVRGSPGANDNASGVAVLLGLCRELKNSHAPVRAVFFDREEAWLRTPLLRLGLLGSSYYTLKCSRRQTEAVYNLELCGTGDCLAVWPVKGRDKYLPAVTGATRAAARVGLPIKNTYAPWPFVSSDHLAFRLRCLANAVTLSLLPGEEILNSEEVLVRLSLSALLSGRRPKLPAAVSARHGPGDTSRGLAEASLARMLALVREIAHNLSDVHG